MAVEYFGTTSGNNFLKYTEGVRFLVKKDDKYGIIGMDEQVIIPAKYDQITRDIVVKQGNVYGLLQTDGSWQLPLLRYYCI